MLKFAVLSISFLLLGFHAIGGILPQIRDSLGITQTQSEVLVTAPSMAILISVMVSNVLVERVGPKKTVSLGLVLSGIGGVLPAFFPPSYVFLLVSRFIFGSGLGLIYTSSVTYINVLFDEQERATLIGFRSAMELVGQTFLTLGIGALAVFGWQRSFLLHGTAFLIAALFNAKVPDVKAPPKAQEPDPVGKVHPIVYLTAGFLGLMALNGSMIAVRFPAMAAEIMGEGYNSSVIVAMKPVLGILAAIAFGRLNGILGKKLLYIGLGFLIASNLMLGFANGNFSLLVTGFLMSSFVLGWVVPIMVNLISRITKGRAQRKAMATILCYVNIALFAMPFVVQLLETVLGSHELQAPYPLMATVMSVALLAIMGSSQSTVIRKKVLG
ncbi:MAG: MFS transporter [Turicibacter sp.]|nr:MFS transporter [Turicibacter sp.]